MDGALNTFGTPYVVPMQASAGSAPPISVDPATQKVFLLGMAPSLKAVIVTLDGTTGQQLGLLDTTNSFSAYSSGRSGRRKVQHGWKYGLNWCGPLCTWQLE